MQNKYAAVLSNGKSVTSYIKKQWLSGNERKFLRCFTRNIFHLGNMTQQRVEGQHGYIKGFASGMSRTNTLGVCATKLSNAIYEQNMRLCLSLDKVSAITYNDYRGIFYSNLVGRVHKWALRKIAEQVALYNNSEAVPLLPCTQEITSTLGLPCVHVLSKHLLAGTPLPVSCLHEFWLIGDEKGDRPEPLKDAMKLVTKRKADGASSSKKPKQGRYGRIPSVFETVEFRAREEEKTQKKTAKVSKKAQAAAAAAETALAAAQADDGEWINEQQMDAILAHHKNKKRSPKPTSQMDIVEDEEEIDFDMWENDL